jgi:hypothetical protein
MRSSCYFDIAARPVPWLLGHIPFFRDLWSNPVFSRSMLKSGVTPIYRVRPYFLLGMAVSAFVSLTFLSTWGYDETYAGMVLVVGTLFPIAGMLGVTHIYMFILCLNMGPILKLRDAGMGEVDPVNTTLLTDREIYYGKAMPRFVYGIGVMRMLLAMLSGLVIPPLEILLLSAMFEVYPWGQVFVELIPLIMILVILFSGLALMMLLLSLASVAYSAFYNPVQTIAFTILHYAAVRGLIEWVGHGFGVWLTNPLYWINYIDKIMTMKGFHLLAMGFTLKVGLVLLACAFTARVGIWMQAKVRRRR